MESIRNGEWLTLHSRAAWTVIQTNLFPYRCSKENTSYPGAGAVATAFNLFFLRSPMQLKIIQGRHLRNTSV